MSLRKKLKAGMALTACADYVGRTYHNVDFCDTMTYQSQNFGFETARIFIILRFKFGFKFYTMYFISYSFNLVYIFIGCINFSSWLGLASMVFVFYIYCT